MLSFMSGSTQQFFYGDRLLSPGMWKSKNAFCLTDQWTKIAHDESQSHALPRERCESPETLLSVNLFFV